MKNFRIVVLCCIFLCLMTGEISAYVRPLEQILSKVRSRFAALNTLIIEQATHVIQSRDPLREQVYKEKVWLRTPRYERTTKMDAPLLPNTGGTVPKTVPGAPSQEKTAENPPDEPLRQPNPDATYRWLLMANPKGELSAFLTQLGIQIWDLGYDRCDGIVAYRVGQRDPQSPKLLVDKERFFPLLLSYVLPGDPDGRLVTVRFKDYRKDDAGWYPYEIEYALEDVPPEIYLVLNLTSNAPIEASFFERRAEPVAPLPRSSVKGEGSDDQRLRKIMRNLEKKYQ